MRRSEARPFAIFSLIFAFLFASDAARPALAAGFAIREQSPTAQGNAFAGATAAAEDPSFMFFNPAAVAYQEGIQALAGASWIMPRARLEDASATTTLGGAIGGRREKGDVAEDIILPVLYGSWQISPEWYAGLGINAPFGLTTEYPDNWVGRYHAVKSELRTLDINPTLAFRPNRKIAVGFGLQINYADAELTNAVDFGTIGAASGIPGSNPTNQDGKSELSGDDWALGWTMGALVEPRKGTRFGLAYRSKIDHRLRGDVDFTLDGAGIGAALSAATGGFVDTAAEAELDLPETISFGFYHEFDDAFAVMGEAALTRWDRFDELRVVFENPNQADSVTEEHWDSSWFFALGATWKPTEAWTLRIGAAHDQTPIKEKNRTPRIPGNDRWWVTVGASWQPMAGVDVSLGYTHIFVEDSEIRLTTGGAGNTFRGNLNASYDNAIDIVTLSGRIRF